MARAAIFTKAVIVFIPVTTDAGGKRQSGKLYITFIFGEFIICNGFMAGGTFLKLMLPGQGIAGFIVIEPGSGLPFFVGVAGQTFFVHLAPMFIRMTGETVCFKTQKGMIRLFFGFYYLIPGGAADMITFVAIAALCPGMGALQHIACLVMIKVFLPALPVNKVKITSMMLHMAGCALFKSLTPVQTLALLNLPF